MRAIDLAAGVLDEGGSHDISVVEKAERRGGGGAADLDMSAAARHSDAWVQLLPKLVAGEGVLLRDGDEDGATSGAAGNGRALLLLSLLLIALLGTPPALVCYMRVRERALGQRRTVGEHGGLARAMGVAACDVLEEQLAVVMPAGACIWWRERARPRMDAASKGVGRRLGGAFASVKDVASRWMSSGSRVRSVAPGSVALPMATIDEEEDEVAEELDERA